VTTALQEPGSVLCVTFCGQLMVGFSPSVTVTVKLQLLVRLLESVAKQVTVVMPFGKAVPEAGEQLGVRLPSQLSLAVTA
jgi:hypothetical protein